MNKRVTLGLLLLTVVALLGIPGTLALSSYLSAFDAQYSIKPGAKLDTCDTCHIPGLPQSVTNLNPYGKNVQSNLGLGINNALTTIEPLDSDKDGFSNIDEIHNMTFPGNSSDFPVIAPTPPPAPAPTATVTFTVNNSLTNSPISGASVVMDGIKIKTGSTGTAAFTNVALGKHTYTVSMRGYKRTSGIVDVTADTSVPVKLTPR